MYPWGNEWDAKKANTSGNDDGFDDTASVGSFAVGASPYGAFDMAGNVREWVQDWYDEKYYQNGPLKNPRGAEKGDYKVLRGGAWRNVPPRACASYRNRFEPGGRSEFVGIRCAQ